MVVELAPELLEFFGRYNAEWVLILIYLAYEIRRGKINETLVGIDKKLTSSIIVIRALARESDTIDTAKVDEYLASNGTEPDDFIVDIEITQDDEVQSRKSAELEESTEDRDIPEYIDTPEEEDGDEDEDTDTDTHSNRSVEDLLETHRKDGNHRTDGGEPDE